MDYAVTLQVHQQKIDKSVNYQKNYFRKNHAKFKIYIPLTVRKVEIKIHTHKIYPITPSMVIEIITATNEAISFHHLHLLFTLILEFTHLGSTLYKFLFIG